MLCVIRFVDRQLVQLTQQNVQIIVKGHLGQRCPQRLDVWGHDSMARSRGRGWFFRTKQPHHFTFLIALILAILGIVSLRLRIDFVSAHAIWFVLAAYVVLALGTLIDGL
jgi:hypothetical protein